MLRTPAVARSLLVTTALSCVPPAIAISLATSPLLGPAPAPMSLLRGRYRYRLLINARRSAQVQNIIRDWLGELNFPQGVRVAVDIDPYSFV